MRALFTCIAVIASASSFAADKGVGSPVWTAETKYDLERTAVGAGGTVVYARDDKKMTALSTADGKLLYERALDGFDTKGYWGKYEDSTYVYSTKKELVGIDVATGKDRWRTAPGDGIDADSATPPAVGHPKALLLTFKNATTVWDIAAGKVLWSAREPLDEKMNPAAWARSYDPESGVLVFLPKRTVLVAGGKEAWSVPEPGNQRRGGADILLSAVEPYGRVLLVYCAKQVALINNATGEVLASQSFPTPEAAADVEAFKLGSDDDTKPLLVTLGGRLVIVDAKDGKVVAKSPEGSIVGQVAAAVPMDGDDYAVMTAVRGNEKTAGAGMHLYRVSAATGEVKWHAVNGGLIDTRLVVRNVLGEKISGPFYLPKASGVLLATEDKGIRFYDAADGKERWAVDETLPYSYRVMSVFGGNSFAAIRSLMQNRVYVSTNPPAVEGDGVVYAAGSDQIFAIEAATGKVRWTSKSKNLSLVSGLGVDGSTVIVRQGLYRDANDHGAPTTIITRPLAPTIVEEPEVYIEEDPYGFVGLDAASGKESWSCVDFEPRDVAYTSALPKDKTVCQVAEAAAKDKSKDCKASKLGVGGILSAYPVEGAGSVFIGKDGIAAQRPGSCSAAWSVEGSVKKMAPIWDLDTGEKSSGFVQYGNPGAIVTHYGDEFSVVDLAAGRVVLAAGKAEVVKVVPSAKLVFASEGNRLSMYKLP